MGGGGGVVPWPYFLVKRRRNSGSRFRREIMASGREDIAVYQGPGNLARGWRYRL